MPVLPRHRLPALAITALFHVLVIIALLHAIPKTSETVTTPSTSDTRITWLPMLPAPDKKPLRRRAAGGSNAITTYFNPYTYAAPRFVPQSQLLALQSVFAACAPENYDMASAEIRTVCGRIGALLRRDPGRFGVTQDIADPKHWQTELARREAPYLLPCMSPAGFAPLYTLYCIYDTLMHGYDPEKRARYSQ